MPRSKTIKRPLEVEDFEKCHHRQVLVNTFLEKSMHILSPNSYMANGYAVKSNDRPYVTPTCQTIAQKEMDCIKQIERQLSPEYPCITIYYSDMDSELENKIILYIARKWDRNNPFTTMSPLLNELERDYSRGWKFERLTNPIRVGRQSASTKARSTFCFRYEPDCYIYKFYNDWEVDRR
ncbi:hypothetical protein EWB00_000059 [Schistosoma japonicum]|uniref:Uncharacterized protein n=2 Tax=Schistosoma japonicum TaxID=6182 RepID=A0A4Z2DL87_SCHJA|nr:hypothetical protein KSF78_0003952 [Schistosoma japonicum]KAH8868257.1 hypothetical protein KSF78_0003952 [Schistosoma japonicum]KAH8868259.1 hypothetical protein KSF78_0003952 [Schistosoma japonicum]TNN16919.1 hypothetical protein EWB00_000059 [Schistosoma japonicum]TNN16920.1 hypothetical protein EWB00_000059 [Schistosoma japonicum]